MIKFEIMDIDTSYVKFFGVVMIAQAKQWPRSKMLAVMDDLAEGENSSRYKTAMREIKREYDPADCDDQLRTGVALAFMLKVFYKHFMLLDDRSIKLSLLHFAEHFAPCIEKVANDDCKLTSSPKGPTRK